MRRAAAVLGLLLGCFLSGPGMAAAQKQDPSSVSKERETIRKQLEALKKDIARSEGRQASAADALKKSEAAISDANRRLAELDQAQKKVTAALDQQTQQLKTQEQQLGARQQQLGELLRSQMTAAGGLSPWGALLSGNDPQESQRNLQYVGYISRARAEAVESLQHELERINQLRASTQAKRDELAALAEEAKKQRETRVRQTEERRKVLRKISSDLTQQQKQAANLVRDEKRLTEVIDRLTKMLAQQAEARARAQRAEAARRAALARREAERQAERHAQASGKLPSATPAPEPAREAAVAQNALLPDPSLSGQFVKLKGRLSLPVRGSVVGRFGQKRDEGGAWRGVFIRASEGTNVHAVAPGKIVFADWMRGFGNLLIIDHGSQYLTIYANNQAILRQVGDDIQPGDVVAQVGSTGGQSESGLYFEIRHQGQPVDPMAWARLR